MISKNDKSFGCIITCRAFFIGTMFLLLFISTSNSYAQKLSIRTNVLELATLSPNLGVDIVLSQHSSLNLEASFNSWKIDNYSFPHLKFSAEYRYWFSETLFRHFIGAGLSAASYKIDAFNKRYYEDWLSLGLSYGYSIMLSPRWNLEPSIGFGCAYKRNTLPNSNKVGFGFQITRISFSLIYLIG